jgi:ABC-2 type transport system ATP-binding protein
MRVSCCLTAIHLVERQATLAVAGGVPKIAFAIRTDNLRKVYGKDAEGREVGLLNLSLEVGQGQIFGLVGPNGSGKTTALKLLLGLIFPDTGTGEILGYKLGDTGYRERIGFLPEEPYYYDHLNALELLRFYGGLFGMGGQALESRIKELLDLVGMWDRRFIRVRNYSRGMRQRVGVAQALINDPDLVFMDEPTSGLDPIGAMQIREVITTIRDRGKTVFLCSHLLKEMEPLCDNVAILARGQLKAFGSVESLLVGKDQVMLTAEQVPVSLTDQLAGLTPRVRFEGQSLTAYFADQSQALQAGQIVAEAGGFLTFLGPQRRSLEEVFIEKVGEES